MADTNIENTTLFGGKPYPNWQHEDFLLPGYQNARIIYQSVTDKTTMLTWGFMISPTSLTIQQGSDIQTGKTMTGWVMSRSGQSIGTLSMSGFFLDTLRAPERLRFFDIYTKYGKDNQNEFMEYCSNWSQEIIIEGTKYYGLIQSITVSKSGNQQFLYQYTINFMFYKSVSAYSYNESKSMSEHEIRTQTGIFSKRDQIPDSDTNTATALQLSEGVYSILSKI